jgi:hypothetical protein
MKKILLSRTLFLALLASVSLMAGPNDMPSLASDAKDGCVDCCSYLCSKDVIATTTVFMSSYPEVLKESSWLACTAGTICCPIVFVGCHLGASTDHLKQRAKQIVGHME